MRLFRRGDSLHVRRRNEEIVTILLTNSLAEISSNYGYQSKVMTLVAQVKVRRKARMSGSHTTFSAFHVGDLQQHAFHRLNLSVFLQTATLSWPA